MTRGDLIAVIITCLYAVLLVGSSEFIQRQFHFPYEFTRKVVHIGTGMWLWAVLVLFDHWQVAVILFAAFTIMNAIILRFHLSKAMDPASGGTLGTVYFTFSCALLFALFHQGWEQGFPGGNEYFAMAGLMAMTWGDASAAIIGKTLGKHLYRVLGGSKRTIEGSLAGGLATFIAVAITLRILSPLSPPAILLGAAIAALVEMLVEAISPWGLDNLAVPIGVALFLFLLL